MRGRELLTEKDNAESGIMPVSQDDVTHRWDRIAEWWIDHVRESPCGDRLRCELLTPTIERALGSVGGQKVLDVGCGEGYLCRRLARAGARPTGLDVCTRLLAAARDGESTGGPEINYLKADATDLSLLEGARFDAVVCNMVLPDVPEYRQLMTEAARHLRPGGTAVWSTLHPGSFKADGTWLMDELGAAVEVCRVPSEYGRWVRSVGMEPDTPAQTLYFHRTERDYRKSIEAAGLDLTRIEEPVPSEELESLWPRSLTEFPAPSPVIVFVAQGGDEGNEW